MPNRPHVLLITADHWPAALLGVAGHSVIRTPTLDQLARNGVRFTNAYSECPVCIPARRTLMTGTDPRTHGDRTFQTELPMPDLPKLAECFVNAGYQAYAAGKLHVFPQRDRIGFHDVTLVEEGRPQYGLTDDWETYLGDRGFPGRGFDHAMSNNEYSCRPWHLPEDCHPTTFIAREMCRSIRRRDPTRPGFWFLSFTHPHPPLVPPRDYLEMYRDDEIPMPPSGAWADDESSLPYRLRLQRNGWAKLAPQAIADAHRAFYALCTHIDHQIRLVVGTLREEGLLDDTILCFTADHGDMLGTHGLWAKRLFLEGSANVPMLLVGTKDCERVGHHRVDGRLVGWQDIMPTLLDLADVPIPETCTGRSMVGDDPRQHLYGECNEGHTATRMVHEGRFKLLYYPIGNRVQLFDLEADPLELVDLSGQAEYAGELESLEALLIAELYGSDLEWLDDGKLVGLPEQDCPPTTNRDLSIQRGIHWPPPPVNPPDAGAQTSKLR